MKMIAGVLMVAVCVLTFGCGADGGGGDSSNRQAPTPPSKTDGQAKTPPSPQVILSEDFERSAIGSSPKSALVAPRDNADAIGVAVRDNAPENARCLQIQDSPDIVPSYWPYLIYSPAVADGVATLAFDVRVDKKIGLLHEWRDGKRSYKTGPALRIESGALRVGGKTLVSLPADTWVRIEVTAGIGAASTGTWRLTVTAQGSPARTFKDLPFTHAEWDRLNWLGFIGIGKTKATCCLDDLLLTVAKAPKP